MKSPLSSPSLEKILRECGLENRLTILDILKEPTTIAGLKAQLAKEGIRKSYATIGRYVDSLRNLELIEEESGHCYLSNKGILFLSNLREVEENLAAVGKFKSLLGRCRVDCLPGKFLKDISVIKKAEAITDAYTFIGRFMEVIGKSQKSIDLLADKVSYQFFEHITNRVLNGVVYKGINSKRHTPTRIQYFNEMVSKNKLEGPELLNFKKRFLLREHEGVPMHLIVIDDKIAGLNFPFRNGTSHLESALASTDEDFVEWVSDIFDYFWSRGGPIKY